MIDYDDSKWGGTFFKFAEDGDKIGGEIVAFDWKHFEADADRAASDAPVYTLRVKDGAEVEVTASYADLKAQLRKTKPQVGDVLWMKRDRKVGNKVLFSISHTPAAGPTAAGASSAPAAAGGMPDESFPFAP